MTKQVLVGQPWLESRPFFLLVASSNSSLTSTTGLSEDFRSFYEIQTYVWSPMRRKLFRLFDEVTLTLDCFAMFWIFLRDSWLPYTIKFFSRLKGSFASFEFDENAIYLWNINLIKRTKRIKKYKLQICIISTALHIALFLRKISVYDEARHLQI